MAGAFIISRDIFENGLWQNNTEFRLFFLIVGKAVFAEEGHKIGNLHIKKGQWLRSYRNLQSDMEYIENNAVKRPGLSTIKRTIEKLISDGRITVANTELGTLFTVCNYCKYQDFEHYKKKAKNTARNNAENSNGTATEQQRNNNNKGDNVNKDEKDIIPFDKIVLRLNEQAGTSYQSSTKTTRDHISARWNEGFRLENFYTVIEKKVSEWKDTEQAKYLRPQTLFGTKFEGYLNQLQSKPILKVVKKSWETDGESPGAILNGVKFYEG